VEDTREWFQTAPLNNQNLGRKVLPDKGAHHVLLEARQNKGQKMK
jgi:hypothetical protein